MRHFFACVAASALAGTAFGGISGGVTSFTDLTSFSKDGPAIGKYPAGWVTFIESESLAGFANGSSYTKLSGGADWSQWCLTATSGMMTVLDGAVVANDIGSGFSFDLGPGLANSGSGLHGFGGDFGFRDAAGKRVAGTIELTLSTGDSLVHEVTAGNAFAGFWTQDAAVTITSMTLRPLGSAGENFRATVDNLYFGFAGVPAPGAVALLGMAGAIASRRR